MKNNKFKTTLKKPIVDRFFERAYLVVCVFFTLLGLSTSANASELSLQEAITKTLEQHPELTIFNYEIQAQKGRATQAELSPKPELQFTLEDAFGSGVHSGVDSAQATLSVSWILENNLKQERINVASKGFTLIDSKKTIKQFDVATQTTRFYLQALYLQEAMKIAQRSIKLAEQTVNELNKRISLGRSPTAELYRAQAELSNRKMDLVDLKHEHLSALHQLAAQWGSSQPDFMSVSGDLKNITSLNSFENLKQRLRNNPEFVRYHAKEKVQQAELKLAQEQQSPRWQFSTGLRRYERTDDYGVVASFSIPFGGSNNNQGNIAQANAAILMNQAEMDAFEIQLESQLFVEFQNYQHSIHLRELLAQNIIPKLEKALKLKKS